MRWVGCGGWVRGGRGVGAGWHSIAWRPLTPPTLTPTHRAAEAVCARRRTGFFASENASIRPAAAIICALPATGTAAHASRAPMPLNDSKEISGVLERRPPKWRPDSWTRKPTDAAMHTRPCLICQGGAQRTASALRTASASSTGYRAAVPPPPCASTRTGCCHTGTCQRCPSGPRACRQSPAPRQAAACRQEAREGQHALRWQRVSTHNVAEGVAHSSAICMFARAGAAGATRDGAWNDCTKVVARTCHRAGAARRQLRLALLLLRRHGSASCGFSGGRPSSQVPFRAASAPGEPSRAGSCACLHV